MRTAALCFFASLGVLGFASDGTDLLAKVRATKTAAEFKRVIDVAKASPGNSEFLNRELEQSDPDDDWGAAKKRLERALTAMTALEDRASPARLSDPKQSAVRILSDPRYRDPGTAQDRNWMSRSMTRLQQSVQDWFNKLNVKSSAPNVGVLGAPMAGLDKVVWFVLGGGLLVFVAFFVAKFRFDRNARNKRLRLLDENEPDLTADEWLTKAIELENDGRIREAVRCLYLASLIRLDEAGWLRFIRADTNWEHLRRFEANPDRPTTVDLRTATREFDRIWYGHQVRGSADSALFKEFYSAVLILMKERSK